MKCELFQRVALTQDVEGHRLCAGDIAYLVDRVPHLSVGEADCVPAVFNSLGESIAALLAPESSIEPLSADEVLSVRYLSATTLHDRNTSPTTLTRFANSRAASVSSRS